jgi:hypothetical protein
MRYDPSLTALLHPERQPPLGPGFPWNEDAMLAECARLAYIRFEAGGEARNTLTAALATFGYGDFAGFFAEGEQVAKFRFDAQAFAVVSKARTALVVFRGTQSDSFRDIVADASFLPVGWRGKGRVHSGFWASLSEALPPILTWLDNTRPSRLIVTGHSLGAAQATLLAGLRDEAELVTFGSPRVGNADFVASLSGRRMKRYVDCLDIVARVPPAPFEHLAGLQYIDRHGTVRPGALTKVERAAERLAAGMAYAPFLLDSNNCPVRDLADHAPINYVSAILGIRSER